MACRSPHPVSSPVLARQGHLVLHRSPGLEAFVEDARIPVDNNATERGLRAAAVGRKNHYGSRSERGTEVGALFYSDRERQVYGHEPAYYLREATRRAIREPGTAMLPQDVALRTRSADDTS